MTDGLSYDPLPPGALPEPPVTRITTLTPPAPNIDPADAAAVAEVLRSTAPGVPITRIDGSTLDIRFDFLALANIEITYGSLKKMAEAIGNTDGPVFTEIARVLWLTTGCQGNFMQDFVPSLDVAQVQGYGKTIGEAMAQAFPTSPTETQQETAPGTSPGPNGVTPPASSSVAPMPSSGA